MALFAVGYRYDARVEVDVLDLPVEYLDVLEELAYRADDMCDIEVRGSHFVEHRRKEEKILAVDQRYFDIRVPCERPVQMESGVQSAESAAEYQYLRLFIHIWPSRPDAGRFIANRIRGAAYSLNNLE